jgi:hypothetical protein
MKKLQISLPKYFFNDGEVRRAIIIDSDPDKNTEEIVMKEQDVIVEFIKPTAQEYCKHCCGICGTFNANCIVLTEAGFGNVKESANIKNAT